jgi:multiple sugar transport system substrate-binding protein/putative aldouronate transport system substrate-binding protein
MKQRKTTARAGCAALSALLLTGMLTGCGSSGSTAATGDSASSSPYAEPLTIDVFDNQANFQGLQAGWYAKIIKEKFNIELNIIAPNVAGGGDTLFQTRSANGNVGDIIIMQADQNVLKDMVTAGLVLDMTPYMDNADNLKKYDMAIQNVSALAGQDGVWAVPSEVSLLNATDSCEVSDPTTAPSLRWDLYEQIGTPSMSTLEDLLPVLQQMQEAAGTTSSGKQAYALSLFKDWDGDFMQNASGIFGIYGYGSSGFALEREDGSDIQSILDDDGMYVRALKFFFTANQMGLVDPESTTQNFDTLSSKYRDGAVLYSLWPWLGNGYYNTTENTSAGKGFATAVIDDMKAYSYGNQVYGKPNVSIMVGSGAKDPQRMVDFIDWLYSPEGIEDGCAQNGSFCGPEGLTWEMKDGTPVLTDFGVQAFVDGDQTLQVPTEWGTGTWKDGISTLNFKPVGNVDCDPTTGMCYNYQTWTDYQTRIETPLKEAWSSHFGGATSAVQYFADNDLLMVKPGVDYTVPEYTTDIQAIKDQCKQVIVQYSWQMVFADDEAAFNSLLSELQTTAKGLGFDQVYAVDVQNCQDLFAAYAKVTSATRETA